MIKSILLLALLPLSGFAQLKEKAFTIQGDLRALPKDSIPAKVYLTYTNFMKKAKDSAVVTNGQYTFRGKVSLPVEVAIERRNAISPVAKFVLSPDKQEVITFPVTRKLDSALAKAFNLPATWIADSSVVKGSVAQDEYQERVVRPVNAEVKSYTDKGVKLGALLGKLKGMTNAAIVQALKENPHAAVAPMLVMMIGTDPANGKLGDTLLQMLPKQLQPVVAREITVTLENARAEAAAGKAAAEAEEKKVTIGMMAPDFTMNDTLNKPVSLSSFRGKYVLVDFWASWCGPCRAENPHVVAAFHRYKDKGFTIIGVSLDAEAQKGAWRDAIHKDGLQWTQLSDLKGWKNAAAELYGIKSIPQNVLIDPQGKVIDKNLRGDRLAERLAEVFR